jgi:IrrE N-terminal-like domain
MSVDNLEEHLAAQEMVAEGVAAKSMPTQSLQALDELFQLAGKYSTHEEYKALLEFVARFRMYSPYNAMLVRIQTPGAVYVATPGRWLNAYKRKILPGARPIAILRPGGPMMFVFDVSETEPLDGAPTLPRSVTHPFEIERGSVGEELDTTIKNIRRDGVRTHFREFGSQYAGHIETAQGNERLAFEYRQLFKTLSVEVPLRYEVVLNDKHSREEQYATLVHELAHLYCGHLGSPNKEWWPHRLNLSQKAQECEAESISYLVCQRLGIHTPSEQYISAYLSKPGETPPISLELVMKVAGNIYDMGKHRLKPRKEPKK